MRSDCCILLPSLNRCGFRCSFRFFCSPHTPSVYLIDQPIARFHHFLFSGLPIAAGALLWAGVHMYPPMAAAAMMCSSLSVVTSSLLLKAYRKPHESSKVCKCLALAIRRKGESFCLGCA